MDNRENVRKESKKAVLIIIPAYNEEKNIVPLLEKLEQPEITQFADVAAWIQSQRDSGSDACQNCRCQYAFRP